MGSRWRLVVSYLARDGIKTTEVKGMPKKEAQTAYRRWSENPLGTVQQVALYETPLDRFGVAGKEKRWGFRDLAAERLAGTPFDDEIPF